MTYLQWIRVAVLNIVNSLTWQCYCSWMQLMAFKSLYLTNIDKMLLEIKALRISPMNKSVIHHTKLISWLSISLQVKLSAYDTIVIFGVSEMVILYFSRHLLSFPSHFVVTFNLHHFDYNFCLECSDAKAAR